jgi:Ion channel
MAPLGVVSGLALILFTLLEAFESIVLPRRVTRPYRFTVFFYRSTWCVWYALSQLVRPPKWRETLLSYYGPLSLLALFAFWAVCLVYGFAILQWSLGSSLGGQGDLAGFFTYVYLSGVTFFTLGYGDVFPTGGLGRFIAATEAGTGFGFLAVSIGYLPAIYQAFSKRELAISLLDARAGSPPNAVRLLRRLGRSGAVASVNPLLAEWERWAAELLESHLSYPVLAYYRSQHDNQSWLGTLAAILDTCALLIARVQGADLYQTQLTFAMARHAVVDLALVFKLPPRPSDRLPDDQLPRLDDLLTSEGLTPRDGPAAGDKLRELRGMYEPFLAAMARYFHLTLPPFLPEKPAVDNWRTSAWMRRVVGIGGLASLAPGDDHFD